MDIELCYDVSTSHSSEDRQLVDEIVAELERGEDSFRPFVDRTGIRPRTDWRRVLDGSICWVPIDGGDLYRVGIALTVGQGRVGEGAATRSPALSRARGPTSSEVAGRSTGGAGRRPDLGGGMGGADRRAPEDDRGTLQTRVGPALRAGRSHSRPERGVRAHRQAGSCRSRSAGRSPAAT